MAVAVWSPASQMRVGVDAVGWDWEGDCSCFRRPARAVSMAVTSLSRNSGEVPNRTPEHMWVTMASDSVLVKADSVSMLGLGPCLSTTLTYSHAEAG